MYLEVSKWRYSCFALTPMTKRDQISGGRANELGFTERVTLIDEKKLPRVQHSAIQYGFTLEDRPMAPWL